MPNIRHFAAGDAGRPARLGCRRNRHSLAALVAAVLTATGVVPTASAWAQGVPVRAPLSAGAPQGSPIPRILPPAAPALGAGVPSLPGPAAAGAVPPVKVPVRSVTIDGATAYAPARLQALAAGLVGPAVPLARIEAARLAIFNLYRADGYLLTTVSAALDAGARLRFTVIEGRIGRVELEGDIGPAGTQVLRFLNHLTERRPLDNASLERWLLLAQDVPGVTLQAVLQPSANAPGALTLVAKVSRQAVSGLLTADNRAFRLTGPDEGLAVLDLNSFTSLGERTEISLYDTSATTQIFGQAATEFFVGGSGLKVRLYGGQGASTPSGPLAAIGYTGLTTEFGAAAGYPVIRSRTQSLNVAAYFDAIDSEVLANTGPAGQQTRNSRDIIRVVRLGADYALEDLLAGARRPATDTAVARLSQGVRGFGATANGNPTPGRAGERVDFTKATLDVSRTQTLFSPWANASVALKGRLAGQYSADILPPVEKLYLGGTELDRGFYAGEVTGDSGWSATAELQLNTDLSFTAFGLAVPATAQFYVFYDQGEVYQNQHAEANARLSSEGIGVRTYLTRFTEIDLEGDVRNTRLPLGTPGVVKPDAAEAFYWRVLVRF